MLLSQAATPIIAVLPAIPPSPSAPYTGGKTTGAVRASLQRALDDYKTGYINLPLPQVSESDLSRSDTRSFGESHANELSSIDSEVSSLSAAHATPLSSAKPLPSSPQSPSLPINVNNLNFSPSPVHISAAETVPDPGNSAQTIPAVTPTIAETGMPLNADVSNPGPSRGSLLNIRHQESTPSTTPVFGSGQKYESAEEEKKRLAAAYRQQDSTEATAQEPSQAAPTPQSEDTEQKKGLEGEEQEKTEHEDLPPYEEPSV